MWGDGRSHVDICIYIRIYNVYPPIGGLSPQGQEGTWSLMGRCVCHRVFLNSASFPWLACLVLERPRLPGLHKLATISAARRWSRRCVRCCCWCTQGRQGANQASQASNCQPSKWSQLCVYWCSDRGLPTTVIASPPVNLHS